MSVPQHLADALLVKCGRRCCICRRFDPLHLQVHHIVPQSQGGTDDPDNLIAVCLTCHSDIHAKTALSRRFTAQELRGHREALIAMVAEGRLLEGSGADAGFQGLIDSIVIALGPSQITQALGGEALSPDAVQMLLIAVKSNGRIFDMSHIVTSSTSVDDVRETSRQKAALDQLEEYDLAAWLSGQLYRITHQGFILADEILAAGSDASDGLQEH